MALIDIFRKIKRRNISNKLLELSNKIKKESFVVEEKKVEKGLLNITYPIEPPYCFANIRYEPSERSLVYIVIEPKLTEREKQVLKTLKEHLINQIEYDITELKEKGIAKNYIKEFVLKLVKKLKINLTKDSLDKIMYYIYRDILGYDKINPLLLDKSIEDISCVGAGVPIYVYHKNYGYLKTNILFENEEDLASFVIKLAQWCNRHISLAEPLLDGSLPTGDRVQAILGSDISKKGSSFTIRKFRKVPLSPIEIIANGTVSSYALAYLWIAVEYGASILVSGGTATGKTTFLNVVSLFIRPEMKIISIEDTPELNLPHEHWSQWIARPGYGPKDVTGKKFGEVDMFDLLKSALRARPNYIIVGEVRGQEAYVLFQGMATGHSGMATIHAENIDELINRLTTPPINLPVNLLSALDLVVFLTHTKVHEKPARRVLSITEIVDVTTDGKIIRSDVFSWKPDVDSIDLTGRSEKIPKIIAIRGESKFLLNEAEFWEEVELRKKILDFMLKNRILEFDRVAEFIKRFYINRDAIIKLVTKS